jgi:4-amino-4-deoxy-L-arabinose transferase-like glycosyltransferase
VLAWLLWRWAAVLFGNFAGLMAFSAFSLNLFTPRLATLVRTDMPLALATFLIGLLFFGRIRLRQSWERRQRMELFFLLAASMLIKGPIVYAFILAAIGLFAWRYRKDTIVRSVATGWWPWVLSLAIFLVWVIGGIKTMPGFYDEVVLKEFVGRFGETFHRPQPLYFYVPHLLHKWAPWSLLLIGLLVVDARAARAAAGATSPTTSEVTTARGRWLARWSPELFWLLAWSAGGLIVMSCVPSKRVDRIFPVVPPLCLLVAALVALGRERDASQHLAHERVARWCVATLLAAMIFASSYTVLKIVSGIRTHRNSLVKCGQEFRRRAASNHWRYAVLKSSDEALVFYLDVPGFINENEAVQRWQAADLDLLIGSERRIRSLLPQLGEGEMSQSEFCVGMKGQQRYTIVQRQK